MRTCKDIQPLQVIDKGEWVDLRLAEDVFLSREEFKILSLGIRVQIPEGYEALLVPRSSTFRDLKILMTNSVGIIDSSYTGPKDIWGFPALAMEATHVKKDTRICQFRILPSMKANSLVREQWVKYDGIEFVEEEWLTGNEESRGGFGSTGKE